MSIEAEQQGRPFLQRYGLSEQDYAAASGGFPVFVRDTDGVDGLEDIAGAYLSPDSIARAWAKGISVKRSLAENDGHSVFEALGDAIVTGPTLTNVNDFRAILITEEAANSAD